MTAWILVVMMCHRQCTPVHAVTGLPKAECEAQAKASSNGWEKKAVCVPEVRYAK